MDKKKKKEKRKKNTQKNFNYIMQLRAPEQLIPIIALTYVYLSDNNQIINVAHIIRDYVHDHNLTENNNKKKNRIP